MRRAILPALLLSLCQLPCPADTFAFFYALDADAQAFARHAQPLGQPVAVGSRRLQRLRLGPHTVISVKMGSGCVETAASAQALLTRFPCDRAYSLGPVGALGDDIPSGDWVRVVQVLPYQKGSHSAAQFQPAPLLSALPATTSPPPAFARARDGVVGSGELFCASSSYRSQLATDLAQALGTSATNAPPPALLIDMNLFGLLTVCRDHGVPLENYRIVSDRADDAASETFRAFASSYDGAMGEALARHLAGLTASPTRPDAYPALQQLLEPAQGEGAPTRKNAR